mmetsp:Transcript_30253/g.5467  ORF Transcript_30253/g.5467 Transcript_30253/m.5467 type:complete len:114 (+) Transcript_30253:195-536(+)
MIPQVSVSHGVPSVLLPLIVILIITAFRDFFEDYKRSKADKEENNKQVLCYVDGGWEKCLWKNIRVGDVVYIQNKESFPADLVLLSSSDPSGVCYVETKNIDGETGYKTKVVN